MDVTGMTLEGFFLADYERMRMKVEELEAEIERLKPDMYGCIDQHESCSAVLVEVCTAYDLHGYTYEGIDLDELKRAYAMNDHDLFNWSQKEYRRGGYLVPLKPIRVKRHEFQYTLTFSESRGSHTYVTDGEKNSRMLEIDCTEDNMVDNLNRWCRERYLPQLKSAALIELRSAIKHAIVKLHKKEA